MEIVGVWLLDEVGEYCRRACGWNRLYSGFWLAGICINSEHVQTSAHRDADCRTVLMVSGTDLKFDELAVAIVVN